MKRQALPIVVVVLALTVVPAACGDDEERPSSPASTLPASEPTPSAPTASGSGLDGTWGIDVAEKDTTKDAGAEPGHWTLEIEAGDATFHGPDDRTIPLQPTEISETRMVVPPDPTCPNNRPRPGKGTYQVHLSGDTLRFTKLADPCGDRAFTFTVHTWRRER